jgi:dihydroorotate dehydrogenase
MYRILKPLLFKLDAERSHDFVFALLRLGYSVPGVSYVVRARLRASVPPLPVDTMGLHFPNPIGLAAGLDKNARYLRQLADVGFGWIEVGTVTPRAQAGNPKRRLFRLVPQRALINRMGFNNDGLDTFVSNLTKTTPKPCLVGVNIGKNKDTPNERAVDDYIQALRAVYIHAAYVAVNISSPNTPGLRALQEQEHVDVLLRALKTEQQALAHAYGFYVPLALKIAPDLSDDQIRSLARAVVAEQFDAVIATNTTLARPNVEGTTLASEAGGLSGQPLKQLSTDAIRKLYRELQGRVPIIGVGGIETADDAWEKMVAGADLLQVYTGFIYRGPTLVQDIVTGLQDRMRALGHPTLAQTLATVRRAASA